MFSTIALITRILRPHALALTSAHQFNSSIFSIRMATTTPRRIHTAACLIIGDEVLNGKTVDTNSAFMAKWCFKNGISLKRIETIEDDEAEIIKAVQRMSGRYDFVVTSGGIGPTHDDITYPSIAKAFDLPLTLHDATAARMRRLGKKDGDFDWDLDTPQRDAKLRMARLPLRITTDNKDQDGEHANLSVIFPYEDLWVPVVVVNENVHILPGVPHLFERLLDGILPSIAARIANRDTHMHRILVSTSQSESRIAGYLTRLAAEVADKDIKVGSYPQWSEALQDDLNTVSLVGRDLQLLEKLAEDVVQNVDGKRVVVQDEGGEVVQGNIL